MKITPALAAAAAALATAPAAAVASASIPALADQALAWAVTVVVTAAVSAIAGVVAKLTGATLDRQARDAIQVTLTNAANAAIRWMLTEAADTPVGQRIEAAIKGMLPYADSGAPGSLARHGMDPGGPKRAHLHDMARAKLVEQLGKVAPEQIAAAIQQPR